MEGEEQIPAHNAEKAQAASGAVNQTSVPAA